MTALERLGELSRVPHAELGGVFATGRPPAIDELVGWDFGGWNCSFLPRLGGFQKFVKGFYRSSVGSAETAEGFNAPVLQNGVDGDWLALPADDEPKRFGFYRVEHEPDGALLLDYGAHPRNPRFDPSRLLRDLLVEVDGSSDILLGRAHLALGKRVFVGYFLLARRRPHSFLGAVSTAATNRASMFARS